MIAIDIMEAKLPATNTVMYFTGLLVSCLVLALYCIRNDAYWGLNNNVRYHIRLFVVIGAVNLIYGILEIIKGNMIVNGTLQNYFINFEAGIFVVVLGILLLLKNRKENNGEGEC